MRLFLGCTASRLDNRRYFERTETRRSQREVLCDLCLSATLASDCELPCLSSDRSFRTRRKGEGTRASTHTHSRTLVIAHAHAHTVRRTLLRSSSICCCSFFACHCHCCPPSPRHDSDSVFPRSVHEEVELVFFRIVSSFRFVCTPSDQTLSVDR